MKLSKDALHIDVLRLDEAIVLQPMLAQEAGTNAANARDEYDRMKARFEIIEAECDRAVRADPGKYGIDPDKPTEPAIKHAVTTHPRRVKAQSAMLAAKADVGLADAFMESVQHKKRMLEITATLNGQQYFGEVSLTRDYKKIAEEEMKREARGAVKKKRKE